MYKTTYGEYPRRQFSGRQITEHPIDCTGSSFFQLVWIRSIPRKIIIHALFLFINLIHFCGLALFSLPWPFLGQDTSSGQQVSGLFAT